MATVGGLVVELSADIVTFKNDMGKAVSIMNSSAAKMNKQIAFIEKGFKLLRSGIAGLGVGLGFVELIGFLSKTVDAAMEAEKTQARLNAVIRATGNSAGLTAKEFEDLADSLSQSTRFDDEAIKQAATTMAMFRNVSGDTFKDAIKYATDLSVTLGGDLQSAAQKVGRALDDPITGLRGLRDIGISFTTSQKEMIKSLIDTGDTAGAQRIILDQLGQTIGGQAAAENTGLVGSANALRKAWDELMESMGGSTAVGGSTNIILDSMTIVISELDKRLFKSNQLLDQYNQRARKLPGAIQGDPGFAHLQGKSLAEIQAMQAARAQAEEQRIAREIDKMLAEEATLRRQGFIERQKYAQESSQEELQDEQELLDARREGFLELGRMRQEMVMDEVTAMDNLKAEWLDTTTQMDNATVSWANNAAAALTDFAMTGKLDFKSFANSVIADLIRIRTQEMLVKAFSAIGTGAGSTSSAGEPTGYEDIGITYGGQRAAGGPVSGGKSYIVGENGPELFTPKNSGSITSNNKMGGGDTYVIDARGADSQGMLRLENMIRQLNGSIEFRAEAAVTTAVRRNRMAIA